MIIVEYLVILFFLTTLIITAGAMYSKYISKSKKEVEAKNELNKALLSNNRQRIENAVIIYNEYFDKTTKEAVKTRVNELYAEEDDVILERKINEL